MNFHFKNNFLKKKREIEVLLSQHVSWYWNDIWKMVEQPILYCKIEI